MSTSPAPSRGAKAVLITSGLLAASACFAYLHWRPAPVSPDQELARLADEIAGLRENTDDARESWRTRRDGLQQNAWTRQGIDALVADLGAKWHWEWPESHRATVERSQPEDEDWTAYVTAVETLTRKPGLTVETMEIRAAGIGRVRRFTKLRMGLRFQPRDSPHPASASFLPDTPMSPAGISTETKPKDPP